MQKRTLGKSGLEVSALGFGCMGLSFGYGPATEKTAAINLIRKAYDAGVTFFDSAEAYGPFKNEELVGEAFATVQDKPVIANKVRLREWRSVARSRQPPRAYPRGCRGCLEALEDGCELYQYRLEPNVPIEDVAATVKDLIAQGKVLHFHVER